MKTLLIALTTTVLSLSNAEAGTRRPAYAGYCAPVLTHTCLVTRRCEWRTGYTPCGYCYRYQVMVTVTRGYYSDGTTRTWSQTTRVA